MCGRGRPHDSRSATPRTRTCPWGPRGCRRYNDSQGRSFAARQPFSHPTDEDLSVGAPWMPALTTTIFRADPFARLRSVQDDSALGRISQGRKPRVVGDRTGHLGISAIRRLTRRRGRLLDSIFYVINILSWSIAHLWNSALNEVPFAMRYFTQVILTELFYPANIMKWIRISPTPPSAEADD